MRCVVAGCFEREENNRKKERYTPLLHRLLIPVAFGLFVGLPTHHASAQVDTVRITNDAVQSAVQAAIQSARDRAYARRGGNVPGGFPGPAQLGGPGDGPALLGGPTDSAKSYLKGSSSPVAPGLDFAIWSSGTYTREEVSGTFHGTDLGSKSDTWNVLGGFDFTTLAPTNGVTVVYGLLGGFTDTRVETAARLRTSTQSVTGGGYAAFLIGQLSTDVSITVTDTPDDVHSTSYTLANNWQYRFNLGGNSYFEPTIGWSWTDTQIVGVDDNDTLRLQGGARIGTSVGKVAFSLTGLLYSDVWMTAPNALTEGQLWGKGVGKIDFNWTQKFSTYIQGEIYGTRGDEDHSGYTATVGGRLVF